MRKIIAGTVLAALALTGCGSDSDSPSNSFDRLGGSNEQALVEAIQDEIPQTRSVPDNDIIDLGESICDGLDVGQPILEVLQNGVAAGFTPYEAGFITGASIAALCPEHEDLVHDLESDLDSA